jgi:O-antigen/teichoic acid export membrane protein
MVVRQPKSEPPTTQRPPLALSALMTYGSQIGAAVFSLANVLVIARTLGPVGRGDVVYVTTIAYLTSQFAALGIHQAHANLAGQKPHLRPALASNSVVFSLLLGVVAAGFLALLIFWFPAVGGEADATVRWLALGAIPILILQYYLLFLVQADYGFGAANIAHMLGPFVNVTVNGLLAALGMLTVFTAVATTIGGQVLSTALLALYLHHRLAGFGRPDRTLLREAMGFGLKAHAGRVMLLGNYRLDQWFVGAIAGSRELGLYSVAVAWAEALFFLPTALVSVQRPDLVRAQPREAARQAATLFRVAMLLTLVPAAILVAAAPFLCVTLFGDAFHGSIDDLRVLAFGAFGIVALKQLGSALTSQGKPVLETAAIAVGFAATVALDIALIPPFGGLGAAIASTVAYTAGGIAVVLIFARALGGSLADLVPRGRELPTFWRKAWTGIRAG